MPEKAIAFLDILGFKNYTVSNPVAAATLIQNYQTVMLDRQVAAQLPPDPEIQNVPEFSEKFAVDSFEQFLPFSDSILAVSAHPDKFLKQVATFLIASFSVNSNAYPNSENPEDPTRVTEHVIGFNSDGKFTKTDRPSNWYPLLFRGGFSFGELVYSEAIGIRNHEPFSVPHVVGESLIKAVALEQCGVKGPRMICDMAFVNSLDAKSKQFVEPLQGTEYHEILWPSFHYTDGIKFDIEIGEFLDLFRPAASLWLAFNHRDFGLHYYEFVRLVVKSTVRFFEQTGEQDRARDYISDAIKKYGLESKMKDLMAC